MTIKCTHPVRAHVLANFLHENQIPALVVGEMDSVLCYGIGGAGVFVPDAFIEQTREALECRKPELPDDPEYIYEDGAEPRRLSWFEIDIEPRRFFALLALVLISLATMAAVAIVADYVGWRAFWK